MILHYVHKRAENCDDQYEWQPGFKKAEHADVFTAKEHHECELDHVPILLALVAHDV